MPTITQTTVIDIKPERFLENCSQTELMEVDLLLAKYTDPNPNAYYKHTNSLGVFYVHMYKGEPKLYLLFTPDDKRILRTEKNLTEQMAAGQLQLTPIGAEEFLTALEQLV